MLEDEFAAYFGYGSLVNRRTLRTAFHACHRASLTGWRRHWQSRGTDGTAQTGPIALLSVHRSAATRIGGMVVVDRRAHLAEVDAREHLYDRVAVDPADITHGEAVAPAFPAECHIYVGRKAEGPAEPRLLQSYLDAVMAGFLAEFGEEGVADFIATTDGFERGIIEDRAAPLYPRAVEVDAATAAWFDRLLLDAGVQFASRGRIFIGNAPAPSL